MPNFVMTRINRIGHNSRTAPKLDDAVDCGVTQPWLGIGC